MDEPAGDFERDTAVEGGDGRYKAVLSDAWAALGAGRRLRLGDRAARRRCAQPLREAGELLVQLPRASLASSRSRSRSPR